MKDEQIELEASPRSAGAARHFVGSLLARWGLDDLADTAALLVSELVTNAVLYAPDDVRLRVTALPGGVRVEVVDASAVLPEARSADVTAPTGRGLALVEALADAWGAEPVGPGKVVWFELQRRLAHGQVARPAGVGDDVVAAAPVGLAVVDDHLHFTRVNAAFAELDGVPAGDHPGREIVEVLAGMGPAIAEDVRRVLALGGDIREREVSGEVAAHPGEIRHWLVSTYAAGAGDTGLVVVDITERTRTERSTRAVADATEQRLAFLAEAGEVLSTSLDVDRTLRQLCQLVVPRLADSCSVQLLDPRGLVIVAQANVDANNEALMQEIADRHELSRNRALERVAATGTPLILPEITDADVVAMADGPLHLAVLRGLDLRSGLAVPLVARDQVIGVLAMTMTSQSSRRFSQADVGFAGELAKRAAVAVDNALLFRTRSEENRALQQSLLPPRLPDVPGLDIAARYLPAGEGSEVGGDFYDVFATSSGRWGVVVGDVCGKGPAAASLTALARYTIRAAARHEPSPASVLRVLNETIVEHDDSERFCTIVHLQVDPGDAGVSVRTAVGGHPPPIVLGPTGSVRSLGRPGSAIGLFPDADLTDTTDVLQPGDALVLYTDGVVEARSSNGAFFAERFDDVLAGLGGATAEEIADALVAAVLDFQQRDHRDDIAVLVLAVPTSGFGPPAVTP